jgi:uncharacterized membrane protein
MGPVVATMLSFVLMTVSLICLLLAVAPRLPSLPQRTHRAISRIVTLGCLTLAIGGLGFFIYIGFACFRPQVYYNDGALLDQNAAVLLLHGDDPYSRSDIVAAARAVHQPAQYLTPLRQGRLAHQANYPSASELEVLLAREPVGHPSQVAEFETHVSYPALAFLTLTPLIWAGSPTTLPLYVCCAVLLAIICIRSARRDWRWWVALLVLADTPVMSAALTGSIDVLCVLFVLLAWLQRRHWWASAIWMGLALATKQTTWPYLPFYLIFVYQFSGLRDATRRFTVACALFLAVNLPFIAVDSGAWIAGLLAPMRDPMYPSGAGLIALSVAHIAPYLSRNFYLVLECLGMAAALALYWRWARVRPDAAMVLAMLPLFLAWRSLPSYFEFCALLTIALLASHPRTGQHTLSPSYEPGAVVG